MFFDNSLFPVYKNSPFSVYLKASSLFNKSLLYENELINIYCNTIHTNPNQIILELILEPQVVGLHISIEKIDSIDDLIMSPAYVRNYHLNHQLKLTLKPSGSNEEDRFMSTI